MCVCVCVCVSARDLETTKRGGLCPFRTLAPQIKKKILIEVTEIKLNANLMQLGNFIDVFLARHVSGT